MCFTMSVFVQKPKKLRKLVKSLRQKINKIFFSFYSSGNNNDVNVILTRVCTDEVAIKYRQIKFGG